MSSHDTHRTPPPFLRLTDPSLYFRTSEADHLLGCMKDFRAAIRRANASSDDDVRFDGTLLREHRDRCQAEFDSLLERLASAGVPQSYLADIDLLREQAPVHVQNLPLLRLIAKLSALSHHIAIADMFLLVEVSDPADCQELRAAQAVFAAATSLRAKICTDFSELISNHPECDLDAEELVLIVHPDVGLILVAEADVSYFTASAG